MIINSIPTDSHKSTHAFIKMFSEKFPLRHFRADLSFDPDTDGISDFVVVKLIAEGAESTITVGCHYIKIKAVRGELDEVVYNACMDLFDYFYHAFSKP